MCATTNEISCICKVGDHSAGRRKPLSARLTLAKLGIPRTTFYRWYDRYLLRGGVVTKLTLFTSHVCSAPLVHVSMHCRAMDNGSSYVSGDLAEWLQDKGMKHSRGAPYHPQTQGKIPLETLLRNTLSGSGTGQTKAARNATLAMQTTRRAINPTR